MSLAAVPSPGFKDHLVEEGEAMVAEAERRGFPMRLMGGVGIRLLLGDRFSPAFAREHRDIDAIVRRRDSRAAEELIGARGWDAAREFNALNGARRLLFHDPRSDAQVDVFVENFEMCHKLPLAAALDEPGPALPATELFMTKLQIVELNAKDRTDLYALLAGAEVRDGDPAAIDPKRIAVLTSREWGLQHTFELNLSRLLDGLPGSGLTGDDERAVSDGIKAVAAAMDDAPKSRGWRMRARLGERKRWYEEPEEVDRARGD